MKKNTIEEKKKIVFLGFFKKHKGIIAVTSVFVIFVFSLLAVNYGKYVLNVAYSYYLKTQNFYFNSDKLVPEGLNKTYEINPWRGGTSEVQQINLTFDTLKNSLVKTSTDVVFDLSCDVESSLVGKVKCNVDDGSATANVGSKKFTISENGSGTLGVALYVVALTDLEAAKVNSVSISVKARTTSPYTYTLAANFKIIIGDYGMVYTLQDESGRIYVDSLISNQDKSKNTCINLTFDPRYITLDTTSKFYRENMATFNNDKLAKSLKVTVNSESSALVRFYKTDSTQDYSCTECNAANIIQFEKISDTACS